MKIDNKKKLLCAFIVISFLAVFSILVVGAQERGQAPILPCTFYGNVTLDGASAPIGTEILAKIDNQTHGNITVMEEGKYGVAGGFGAKLVVIGTAEDESKIISFYVGGFKAEEKAIWHSGGVNRLDLSVKKSNIFEDDGNVKGNGNVSMLIVPIVLVIAVIILYVGFRKGYLGFRKKDKKW